MSLLEDTDLKSRFVELREDDQGCVPEFGAMWDRVKAGKREAGSGKRATGRVATESGRVEAGGDPGAGSARLVRLAAVWGAVAAAAGVLLMFGFTSRRWRDREASSIVMQPSISRWRSPTAGLLMVPGRELLAPRAILSSVLDGATRMPVQRKGD